MINKILMGIMKIIIKLVSVLLVPIDNLISSLLPSLSNVLTSVASFLSVVTRSIGWVISLTGLSSSCISMLVLYFGFSLTAPLAFSLIKLALSWYNKLKL